MASMTITQKMADALGCTANVNGRPVMIMSHPRTQAGLVSRGLADQSGSLTDSGMYLAWLLANGSKRRTWRREVIESGARTWRLGRDRDTVKATLQDRKMGWVS